MTTHRYRLNFPARGGACMHATADGHAPIVGELHGHAVWEGARVVGGPMAMAGVVSSRDWIVDARGCAVWAGLLDRLWEGRRHGPA